MADSAETHVDEAIMEEETQNRGSPTCLFFDSRSHASADCFVDGRTGFGIEGDR